VAYIVLYGDVRIYKGNAMLGILRAMVSEAREILSYTTDDMAKILNSAKCRLIVVSSNASRVKEEYMSFQERRNFWRKSRACATAY